MTSGLSLVVRVRVRVPVAVVVRVTLGERVDGRADGLDAALGLGGLVGQVLLDLGEEEAVAAVAVLRRVVGGSLSAARLASMSSSERAYIASQSGMNSRSPPTISSQPSVMSLVASVEALTGLLTPKMTWAPEAAK